VVTITASSVPWLELGVWLTRSLPLRREERGHRKHGTSCEHVVDRSADLVREDRERLPLAAVLLEPRHELGDGRRVRVPQKQDGRLGERPLEVHVAHLGAAGAEHLTGRFVGALDEAGVRGELLHPIEPPDVVDLIEDGQREDRPDAGHRPQAVERIRVVALRLADERLLEVSDEDIVLVDEREVDLDTLADAGGLESGD
jgi:hypothetical protein